MSIEHYINKIDRQRVLKGYLRVAELLELSERGNIFLDPFSSLVSREAVIGEGNLFYPNIVIETKDGGTLAIGDGNTFYPNSFLLAERGKIVIASGNQFGDGGCSIKANMPDAVVEVGDNGRYMNGAQIIGKTKLGTGSQVLGPITVQSCILEAGGDYLSKDVDLRAGLLKGLGIAKNLTVPVGKVINGNGVFEQAAVESQSTYHPK